MVILAGKSGRRRLSTTSLSENRDLKIRGRGARTATGVDGED